MTMFKKLIKSFKESNHDKHFVGGLLCGLAGGLPGAIIAGMCLEFKDKQYGNVFDWSDVILTALGGIPGQVLWLLIL